MCELSSGLACAHQPNLHLLCRSIACAANSPHQHAHTHTHTHTHLLLSTLQGHLGVQTLCCGRCVCDVKVCARELVRVQSYDLPSLVDAILHSHHSTLEPDHALASFGLVSMTTSGSERWNVLFVCLFVDEHICCHSNSENLGS